MGPGRLGNLALRIRRWGVVFYAPATTRATTLARVVWMAGKVSRARVWSSSWTWA